MATRAELRRQALSGRPAAETADVAAGVEIGTELAEQLARNKRYSYLMGFAALATVPIGAIPGDLSVLIAGLVLTAVWLVGYTVTRRQERRVLTALDANRRMLGEAP